MMITLPDSDRQFLLELLMRRVPRNSAPSEQVRRLISTFSGTDTSIRVHRAYPPWQAPSVEDINPPEEAPDVTDNDKQQQSHARL